MIAIREATIGDVEGVRDVYQSEYGDHYAYPQYYNVEELSRLVYADGSIMLVAIDSESNRVAGTASVVFSVGAHNDLIGEFGRLVVHPDFRGRGIGGQLMQGRIERVKSRLHVGIVENRAAHVFSQRISSRHGFVPTGFLPMKLLLDRRESVALYVRYFGDALALRRNNPRIIPEATTLAGLALENCKLPTDAIVDDTSAPYPPNGDFELDELATEGYASLLRIERGRLKNRDVFGPIKLHYGLFQLRARHSHYLIARRQNQIAGGIGFMIDEAEKVARVFELISVSDEPIRFLLEALMQRCQRELDVDYIEVDVNAHSPRMQRTLLEFGFLPVGYIPAHVFHEVERLDAIKMSRLLVPFELGNVHFCDAMQPIADAVIASFAAREVSPRISAASQQSPLFDGLSDEQRQRLLGICHARTFQAGDPILRAGATDGTLHLLLSGKVTLMGDDDRRIGEVTAGQCLGESASLCSPTALPAHSINAIADTLVETAAFENGQLQELIRARPDIGVTLYRNLAADVSAKLRHACQPEREPRRSTN